MSILQTIQTQLKAEKNQYNSFGKYNYRNAESILESLKPLLAKHQYSVVLRDDIEEYGGRLFLKATINLLDEKMQLVVTTHSLAELPVSLKGMSSMQVTGATSSYARKYALGDMFLLDDSKDSDSMDNSQPQVAMVTAEQVKYISTLITTKEIDRDKVKQAYKVESMNDLTADNALKLIEQLKKK